MNCRAVARSENLGGHIVLGGDNVPPLVEIGLIDLPKSEGHVPPRPPRLRRAWLGGRGWLSEAVTPTISLSFYNIISISSKDINHFVFHLPSNKAKIGRLFGKVSKRWPIFGSKICL